MEQHGTLTIISIKSVTGANILPITLYFKVKRYPDGRLLGFKSILCARGDRQVEGVDYFENIPLLSLGLQSYSC